MCNVWKGSTEGYGGCVRAQAPEHHGRRINNCVDNQKVLHADRSWQVKWQGTYQ